MITISVKSSLWRSEDSLKEKSDHQFSAIKQSIVERDRFTCQSCGFKVPAKIGTQNYMEVHHVNDCHTDNSPDNLMTVCPFCHSRAHFGLAHIQDRGFFIQSPIFTQKTFHLALVPLWFSTELPGLEKVNQYLPVYRQWIENVIQKDRLFLEKAIPNFKDGAHLANLYLLAVKRKDKQVINSLSHQMSRDSLILVPNILHERYQAAAKSWSKSIIKASSNEKIGHWLNGIVGKNLIKMERYLS